MSVTVEIPFNSIPYQNADSIVLNDLSDSLFDGFIDELGNTNKRQGLKEKVNLNNLGGVDGEYWWENRGLVISVSDGNIYKTINASGTTINITGDKLLSGVRPTFADNGTTITIANGGRMVFTDGTAPTTFIADPDAPTQVTHLAFLDQFLLANEVGTGRFHFADYVTSPTTWFAVDVFTAESSPDNLIALYVNESIIHLYGTKSLEFWINNGVDPFSRLQGTRLERGAMTPYTTVNVQGIEYFFDNKRRLNRLEGQTAQVINTSFDKTIQKFDEVKDMVADNVTVDGRNWIFFHFPTENRTLLYDIQVNYWAELSTFNLTTNKRDRFIGQSYVYAKGFNQHLFGSFKNSKILEMKSDFFDDDGGNIRFSKTTGWINHKKPKNKKRSYRLTLTLKTGTGIGPGGTEEPFLRIRWRDNGNSTYGNFRKVSLHTIGDTQFKADIGGLGSYYSRQYNLEMSENVPFVIGPVFETLDINEF